MVITTLFQKFCFRISGDRPAGGESVFSPDIPGGFCVHTEVWRPLPRHMALDLGCILEPITWGDKRIKKETKQNKMPEPTSREFDSLGLGHL